MRKGQASRRAVLALAGAASVVAVLCMPAAAADYASTPLLEVSMSNHGLFRSVGLSLDAYHLEAAPAAQKMVFGTPAGYSVDLSAPAGTQFGEAYVGAVPPGSPATTASTAFDGYVKVIDAASYAASAAAQACAPGTHTATWDLVMVTKALDRLEVPVAVDAAGGGATTLTLCLDALRAQNLVPREVYLRVSGAPQPRPRATATRSVS